MNADVKGLNGISERIIGCAQRVSNTLGCGFLERVYENALAHELGKAGLMVAQQKRFAVVYDRVNVGDYIADLVVEDQIIVETKVIMAVEDMPMAQCLNYLRATGLKLGLVVNVATPRIMFRRVVNGL